MQNPLTILSTAVQMRAREMWMQSLQPHYETLAEREKLILQFAVLVLPVMVLIFAVLLPLHDEKQMLQQSIVVLQQKADAVKLLADKVQAEGVREGKSDGSVLSTVEALARQSNVRQSMTHIRPRPALDGRQALQLQMKHVAYADVLKFLELLGQQHLQIESAHIGLDDEAADAEANGLVQVQLTVTE